MLILNNKIVINNQVPCKMQCLFLEKNQINEMELVYINY